MFPAVYRGVRNAKLARELLLGQSKRASELPDIPINVIYEVSIREKHGEMLRML